MKFTINLSTVGYKNILLYFMSHRKKVSYFTYKKKFFMCLESFQLSPTFFFFITFGCTDYIEYRLFIDSSTIHPSKFYFDLRGCTSKFSYVPIDIFKVRIWVFNKRSKSYCHFSKLSPTEELYIPCTMG